MATHLKDWVASVKGKIEGSSCCSGSSSCTSHGGSSFSAPSFAHEDAKLANPHPHRMLAGPRVTMEVAHLGVLLESGDTALQGVSAGFRHAQLHGVVGPPGCGKSALMDALAGRLPHGAARVSGQVRGWTHAAGAAAAAPGAAGSRRSCTYRRMRQLTSYVPARCCDAATAGLTVRENVLLAVQLALPAATPYHVLDSAVGRVLRHLGLERVQHRMAVDGGLSRSQTQLLSVGLALASRSSLVLLDEPAAGLGTAAVQRMAHALGRAAEDGMNVVVAMSQPPPCLFACLDTLLLLGPGGRPVFSGPRLLLSSYLYFLGFRPPPGELGADYYLAVVQGAVPRVAHRKGLGSSATLPHPDELADLWTGLGARWLQQQLAGAGGRCGGGGTDPWVDALDRDHVCGRQDSEVSGTWQPMGGSNLELMAFERVQGMCTVSEGEEGEELEDEEEADQERSREVDAAVPRSSGQDTAVGTDLPSSCCGTAIDDTVSLTATTGSTVASAAASPATSSGSSSASPDSSSRGSRRQRKGRRGDQGASRDMEDLGTLDEQEAESKETPLQEKPDVERVSDQDQGRLLPYTGPRDDDVDAWGLGAMPMVGIELGPEPGAGWDSEGSGCGGGGAGELRGLEAFACGALGRRSGASAAHRAGRNKPAVGSTPLAEPAASIGCTGKPASQSAYFPWRRHRNSATKPASCTVPPALCPSMPPTALATVGKRDTDTPSTTTKALPPAASAPLPPATPAPSVTQLPGLPRSLSLPPSSVPGASSPKGTAPSADAGGSTAKGGVSTTEHSPAETPVYHVSGQHISGFPAAVVEAACSAYSGLHDPAGADCKAPCQKAGARHAGPGSSPTDGCDSAGQGQGSKDSSPLREHERAFLQSFDATCVLVVHARGQSTFSPRGGVGGSTTSTASASVTTTAGNGCMAAIRIELAAE